MAGLGWYACTDDHAAAVRFLGEVALGLPCAERARTVTARRIRRSGWVGQSLTVDVSCRRRELDPCPGAPMLVDMSEQRRPSLEIRVTALEWEVRQLRAELIRAKTAGERPTSPMPPFPPVVAAGLPEAPPPPSSETPDPSRSDEHTS